ncbi:MAG: DnaJ domain-containing protein [Rhodobacteraceae bacterium]|uniref:DnaJ domain-containing protein n=1 Tax=Amaricoccus sp. B4 TaxID=3368557 RepID=UPI000DAE9B0C|nr:DnaJ domain-containing protein [Paracoccaceae bacterium]
MSRRSPFEFDISVSADKKRRARSRGQSGAVESSSRVCAHPGCDQPGKYRAPRSPDQLDDFLWFCLKHVREYNLKWNFFESHSDDDLEQQFAADRVWERNTKPFATGSAQPGTQPHSEGRAWQRFGLDDPLELLGDKGTLNPGANRGPVQRRLPPTERRALEILEAQDTQSKAEIRRQYKALVKDLHPDMNGGRRDDEARLAEVVWAWEQIKASRSFRD